MRANARLLLDVNRRANPADGPDPIRLLDDVGLGEFLDAYPRLSGGMQQRVALIRAFALMDEPFAALDEMARADMRHLLGQLCEATSATVLFVTHSSPRRCSCRTESSSCPPDRGIRGHRRHRAAPAPVRRARGRPQFFAHETELRRLLQNGSAR